MGLTGAVQGGNNEHYCTSCYTGVYPVAFLRDEGVLQLGAQAESRTRRNWIRRSRIP